MGKPSTSAPIRSAGVVGTARWKGGSGNRGRPVWHEGSGLNVALGGGASGIRTGSYCALGSAQIGRVQGHRQVGPREPAPAQFRLLGRLIYRLKIAPAGRVPGTQL